MRRLILVVLVLAGAIAWWLLEPVLYARIDAPDGSGEYVLATTMRWRTFLPVSPGQGGDHPGRFVLYDRSGNACDEMRAPMINLLSNLEWERRDVGLRAGESMTRCP